MAKSIKKVNKGLNKKKFGYWLELIVVIFVITAVVIDFTFKCFLKPFESSTSVSVKSIVS